MFSPLRVIMLERGIAPWISALASVLALIFIVRLRPSSKDQLPLPFLLCLAPVIVGIVGYYYGIGTAYSEWCLFVNTHPPRESLEMGKGALMTAYAVAGEPLHLGVLLSLPPFILVLWYGLTSRSQQKRGRS